MKKLLARLFLVLAGVAGLVIPAKAQALLVAKVPFQFVAAGQTFPAGEYKISRLNDADPRILLLSSIQDGAGVVMFATEAQGTSHDKAKLAFATVGDQHFLSRIETANYAFTILAPSTEPLLAAAPRIGAAASSSPGSKCPLPNSSRWVAFRSRDISCLNTEPDGILLSTHLLQKRDVTRQPWCGRPPQ